MGEEEQFDIHLQEQYVRDLLDTLDHGPEEPVRVADLLDAMGSLGLALVPISVFGDPGPMGNPAALAYFVIHQRRANLRAAGRPVDAS